MIFNIDESSQIVTLGVSYSHFLVEMTLLHCGGDSVKNETGRTLFGEKKNFLTNLELKSIIYE